MDCYSPASGKMESSYKLWLKSLDSEYKTKVKKILNGEEKADQLEDLDPKKRHRSKYYGFSFCGICPRLGAGEASNLEKSISIDKKSCSL